MPRRRLFVALVLEPPQRGWLEGVQQACGHAWPPMVPPHITLVPPVNVNEERLGAALALVRRVAATARPVEVTIGPPDTFLPRTPVLYASVADPEGRVATLARRLTAEPLGAPDSRPSRRFVPHVTLARNVDRARVDAARVALAALRIPVRIDRVTTLEQGNDRVWRPLADAELGRRATVGAGGLALTIDRSRLADPEVRAHLCAGGMLDAGITAVEADGTGFVTARRDEQIVGVAAAGRLVVDDQNPDGLDVHRHLRAATGPGG